MTAASRPAPIARHALSVTLALLALWILWHWLDWAVVKAVFRADLQACRDLAHSGACWGVVSEKFRPMLLGRYPIEEQWRPWSMLGLSALSLGALTLMGVGRLPRPKGAVLGVLLTWGLGTVGLMGGGVLGLRAVPLDEWGGLPLTLVLTVLSLGLSLPMGMMLALGRKSTHPWLSWPCTTYIELVRGVPLVTLLFMGAFMLPALFPANFQPGLFVRVSIALTLFSAAYVAEIVRSGLQTVPKEQEEAAQILGLSRWRIYQWVVLPQALRAVLPALTGHTIGLLKDTSLVMVVSMHELTGAMGLALAGDADWRPFYLEGYLFVAMLYACMCLGLGWAGRRLEAQWQRAV